MTVATAVLGTLRSWLGIAESPPGSNMTPIGAAYGWNGVAWCMITASEAQNQNGNPTIHTAGCIDAMAHFQSGAYGTWHGPTETIEPGDIYLLHFPAGHAGPNHAGTCEVGGPGNFTGIEGNIGDAVRREVRDRTYLVGFGRPVYEGAAPVPAAPPWPGRVLVYTPGHALMTGEDVRTWQARMIERGWSLGPSGADGEYGKISATACHNFEVEKGLAVESPYGQVGPQVWAAAWTAPIT